jgi:glycosyltransferase involved in cell wall biosynthesis
MKIAQIAPLYEAVPPDQYGGTERVVANLVNQLVDMGHDVTLFASGDSLTKGRLVSGVELSLRKRMTGEEMIQVAPSIHLRMLNQVSAMATEFDVIHSHVDHLAFPFAEHWPVPSLHTLHGRLDLPPSRNIHGLYSAVPMVSISDSQRWPLTGVPVRWLGTVYNGLDVSSYRFEPRPRGYLAFLGRISPEKRPDLAAEIAHRAGLPLRVAAKVDPVDLDYWEQKIRPLFERYRVDFVGEIGDTEKSEFLGGATAMVFPIDWPEPFGLVMVESLACGTPVVAADRGSVREVIRPGRGGIIANSLDQMVEAVHGIGSLERSMCHREAERFDTSLMARGYLAAYHRLIDEQGSAAMVRSRFRERIPEAS